MDRECLCETHNLKHIVWTPELTTRSRTVRVVRLLHRVLFAFIMMCKLSIGRQTAYYFPTAVHEGVDNPFICESAKSPSNLCRGDILKGVLQGRRNATSMEDVRRAVVSSLRHEHKHCVSINTAA